MDRTLSRRLFAAAIASIICGTAVVRDAVPRLRCNRTETILERRTLAAYQAYDFSAVAPGARRNLMEARECLAQDPMNVNLHMIAGANYRILGRFDEAAAEYREALRYDRRPELYLNLGQTLIAANRHEQGVQALVAAARFYGDEGMIDYVMADVPEREEVKRRLRAERHAEPPVP